jgi:hypothetical protein
LQDALFPHGILPQMGGNDVGTLRKIKHVPHAAQQCGQDGRE